MRFTLWSRINIKTTLTTMDDVILLESEESENSVVELEVPRKPTPPLVFIEDEDIILNVMQENREVLLAKDVIDNDRELSELSKRKISSDHENCPNHWTKDMIKFYNDDWGGEEHFVVEKLQEKMDKTPSLWKVTRKDGKRWRKQVECWNCKQKGHHSISCPEKPYTPKCFMCGTEGHSEYNCPNSKCLNCGRHSDEYVVCCYTCRSQQAEVCSRCHLVGHNFINCTDHWRLFHLTTGTTSVIIPNKNVYKSDNNIWCCNCGRRGHHEVHCKRIKDFSTFTDTLPFVVSYQKAFRDDQPKNTLFDSNSKPKRRRRKQKRKEEDRSEKILQVNPMHKAIRKDKTNFKKKLGRFKKFKRSRKRRKETQGFWDPLSL